jgi:hypothetical protein
LGIFGYYSRYYFVKIFNFSKGFWKENRIIILYADKTDLLRKVADKNGF